MRTCVTNLNGVLRIVGGVSSVMLFAQIAHAKATRVIDIPVTKHSTATVRKVAARRLPTNHVSASVEHPVEIHHVVDRVTSPHPAAVRAAQIHHTVVHHTVAHAAPVHRAVVHAAIRHVVEPRRVDAHPAIVRRVVDRHPAEVHHAEVHHAVVRHVVVHRPVVAHPASIRHVVERRPVEPHHAPVRPVVARRAVEHRPVVHHVVLHEARRDHVRYPHRLASSHGYRWCVPYARDVSHIDIKGDAFLWWAEAAGRYARGHRPEPRAVLNFRPTGRMPLGHVAVVAKVINSREVLVNQANWIPDTVSHDVPVIDVSPHNNWTEVRVALGNGRFGMTYPTYGFIYDQAPSNIVYASNGGTEVAEAPVAHKIRLTAPNRKLR